PFTGPYGWLVTKAIHEKHIYREYIGVDASMADLMRPGMYGAYHHVSVVGKEDAPASKTYDVVGSLCENCDKFAIQRELPEIEKGDFVVIHDAGAHGRAMGFNYNAKLRAGELLLREDGKIIEIRRKEIIDDYFATLDFKKLPGFKA
ncbi:MAG: diaminopimelate decarboxylase, partial [Spirochaetales bacterium]|nr:diaminopimelate decarboxylase [Spirochaetales bacterium]